jgi:hypothetical protein
MLACAGKCSVGFGGNTMIWIANGLVALVAALHVYFLVLEMFLWTKPLGFPQLASEGDRFGGACRQPGTL